MGQILGLALRMAGKGLRGHSMRGSVQAGSVAYWLLVVMVVLAGLLAGELAVLIVGV